MEIKVPGSAARAGQLRVWLRRIPVGSGLVHLLREDGEVVGEAQVYGRGEGSNASERVMLAFRMMPGTAELREGEVLRLQVDAAGDLESTDGLDVLSIE